MPPEASSPPEMGLNRTVTSMSVYGPPGATITLKALSLARCTSARPPCEAPGTPSMGHLPVTVSQPSNGRVKSKRRSDSAAQGRRRPIAMDTPKVAVAVMVSRRDRVVIVPLLCRDSQKSKELQSCRPSYTSPRASASREIDLVERGPQSGGQFCYLVIRPEVHEEQTRLVIEHVIVHGRDLDALCAQNTQHRHV